MNCRLEDILVIENAPLGIESAKKVGLKVFALKTTLSSNFLESADKIFSSHKELVEEIKNII